MSMLKMHKNIYIIYMIIYLIIFLIAVFISAGYMEFTDQQKLIKLGIQGNVSDKELLEYINLYPYWRMSFMITMTASLMITTFLHYLIKISNKNLTLFFIFISIIIYTSSYMVLSYYLYHVVNFSKNTKSIKKWNSEEFNDVF